MRLSRIKSFCFLILTIITVSAFSQEKTVFSGQIITAEPLNSPVHIINITREKGSVSKLSGHFSVELSIGDSLVFSSVQYKKETLVINKENLQQRKFTIRLKESLTELDEVKLHNLSGNLAKDISSLKTFNKFSLNAPMSRKPPPTQVERQIYTATTGPGGSKLSVIGVLTGKIPLAPIMNEINGTLDILKKRKVNSELKFTVEKAIYIISENTFTEDFEITENEVVSFVYYCAENYDLEILLDNPLELYEFFQDKSVEFINFRGLD